ncbi:MAG: metallophosphoesterase [Halobacteriota archaeon]|nr:metallophosphoesterase [Halobacteriota archaeon]
MRRYLAIADIHGNIKAVDRLLREVKDNSEYKSFESVLIAGDLPLTTPPRLIAKYVLKHRNMDREKYSSWVYDPDEKRSRFLKYQIKTTDMILGRLKRLNSPIFYISGNVDCLEVADFIKSEHPDVFLVDDAVLTTANGIQIVGIPGALTQFSRPICDRETNEEAMDEKIEIIKEDIDPQVPTIMLCHEPPLFKIEGGKRDGFSGGTKATTELIRYISPLLVVCGHYHEHLGEYRIGGVPVINPGCLATYRYAIISLNDKDKDCATEVVLKELKRPRLDFIASIYNYRGYFGEQIKMME